MKSALIFSISVLILIAANSCSHTEQVYDNKIVFLHHSTGGIIWQGDEITLIQRIAGRVSPRLIHVIGKKAKLPLLFKEYNNVNNKNYIIYELMFPKLTANNPYDYYNIWVNNSGDELYKGDPTLEILTKQYDVIIFKHCFSAPHIKPDLDTVDINSKLKTLANYKLQYTALRDKLHEFPDAKFILFTGAAEVKSQIIEDDAKRAREFFKWVTEEWDLPGDNIHIWDLYSLQTEGGLYFGDENAISPTNSHPNGDFARIIVNLLFKRIIDVIENDGIETNLRGENKYEN
jgi:hypothetical protein